MNLMHSSTASLLWESSATTTGPDCRLLLFLAGVHSGEREAALEPEELFLLGVDQNAMTTLTLARRQNLAAVHRALLRRRQPPRACLGRSRPDCAVRPWSDLLAWRENIGLPLVVISGLILVHSLPFLIVFVR
jgi:hypothetical protein